ncbi:MAG TPA: hypothetical protein VFJ17_08010 [Mycobacteriales bacterium]|nr:hypothetical protein [Mycobacteriales bacterium]
MPSLRTIALTAAVAALLVPASAEAGKPRQTATAATYDVSYPQCGGALPSKIDGGIVGVNGGIVYSANPCLATEWAWAAKATTYTPALYANTANPGPAYSSHWPTGKTTPQPCDGSNSASCSYDYGWYAAKDSFADAAAVTSSAAGVAWWLDVETGNSWETLESAYGQTADAQANDRAALAGAVDALHNSGVQSVGIYSTSYQWQQITGGTGTQFAGQPIWVAGTGSLKTANSNCTSTPFTGGPIQLAQYAQSGYDANTHC